MYTFLQSLKDLNDVFITGLVVGSMAYRSAPFHVRQKAHMLQHLVEEGLPLWGNPRNFWRYMDESFVGAMKGAATRSKHRSTLQDTVMRKSRLFAGVQAFLEAEAP